MDMFKERFLEWLKAAGIRALKTTAQALTAGIGTTAVLSLSLIHISEPTRRS